MKQLQQNGFSLIELMIALAIVGILAAITYPSYQDSVMKSRRTDAGNTGNPTIFSATSPVDGETPYYI